MAAAFGILRRTVTAMQLGARALPAKPVQTLFLAPTRLFTTSSPVAAAKKAQPVEEPAFDEYEDEFGEMDPLEGLSAAVRRRVLALKEVQTKYDNISVNYQKDLAQLQAKYLEKYDPLFKERKAIVLGEKDVGKFDIEDDDEPDEKSIPEFWLTALVNHDKVGQYITERDAEVLKHLVDIRTEVLTGEERGFKLFFDFKDNKFFSNKTLEKTYMLEAVDDIIPKQFIGCKIEWKDPSVDVTVEQRKKRVKSKDGAKGKPTFTMESVPCESFFNIFDPPQIPENPEALSDEDMDGLQEELTADFDVGFAIKENIIPRAVEWFTGEIAPMGDYDFEDGEGEEEEEEEPPMPAAGRGSRR